MRKVWKYEVPIGDDDIVLAMPGGAQIVDVQAQNQMTCLWAIVDPDRVAFERVFRWVGTGHPIDFEGEYQGTVHVYGGSLVFHLFEVKP